MLTVTDLHAHYGKSHVLQGVNLTVNSGEAVAVLGRNGVGKTTTLKAIMGLLPPSAGSVKFNGVFLNKLPAFKVPAQRIGYVPQGRHIFPKLTVYENLCLGLPKDPPDAELEPIFAQFRRLKERLNQLGGTLSGGEQQMLAIARCLVLKPQLLILDEPTEGIMPKLVADLRAEIKRINQGGVSLLLVEQNVPTALAVASRVYFMEKGRICHEAPSERLKANPEEAHRFLGVAR
jgi:branched-chain amino acid transport system ATP-binding protein